MTELEPLADEVRDLLDAERDIEPPAAATRKRMLERLAVVVPIAIGAGAAATAASGAGASAVGSAARATASVGLKGKILLAVIAASVGAVGGAATHAALTKSPAPPRAAPALMRARPSPPATTASAEPYAPPSAAAPQQPAPAAAAVPASSVAPRAENRANSLRSERLLLERATAALMRGDAAAAVSSLREHAQRFPRGELAEEREVLFVRALRAQGQSKLAEQRAKDFKRKFPSSLQQNAVEPAPASPGSPAAN